MGLKMLLMWASQVLTAVTAFFGYQVTSSYEKRISPHCTAIITTDVVSF